ncbi:MAG: hypothetical protein PHE59_02135 [Patescibacteria group bacterium]|nr:hypothetical protein [Patescibacteria group bacterium]MDD5164748.1 hypothetical protein [Patescibacteria group bacterium]MDD5534581.1 hypothetical protein [Patescibacteria group bacterium]
MDAINNVGHQGYQQIATNPNKVIETDEIDKTIKEIEQAKKRLETQPIEPISACSSADKPKEEKTGTNIDLYG